MTLLAGIRDYGFGLSNSFPREANPTGEHQFRDFVFSHLQMAKEVL
jgi:hypothetical protein